MMQQDRTIEIFGTPRTRVRGGFPFFEVAVNHGAEWQKMRRFAYEAEAVAAAAEDMHEIETGWRGTPCSVAIRCARLNRPSVTIHLWTWSGTAWKEH